MHEDTPLRKVREHINKHAADGLECPACEQHVQIYWRTINAGMAASTVRMLRLHNLDIARGVRERRFIYLPQEIGRRSAEEAKLVWWGLVEEELARRPDGGRAGYWRLTEKGMQWSKGEISVPRYAKVFDGKLWPDGLTSVSKSGHKKPETWVHGALGDHFNYRALLDGEA